MELLTTARSSEYSSDSIMNPTSFDRDLKVNLPSKSEDEMSSRKTFHIPKWSDGWRFGAFLGMIMAFVVLILNITLTIWGTLRSSASNGHIFQGNCKVAERLNMSIHIVINILSTLLLGASNFSMQCICAPTRKDINLAHREGRWLDIGVQSFRNLKFLSRTKRWLWMALALSSLPLHLL